MTSQDAILLTLDRVFAAEDVRQRDCCSVRRYRGEVEYTICLLKQHLVRVKHWETMSEYARERTFNPGFIVLMRELEAMEKYATETLEDKSDESEM